MSGPPTQASLLLRLRNRRDDRSWSEFVEIYTPLVYRYCRNRGLQDGDAADVAQDVMSTVAATIDRFDYDEGRGLFRSWLFTVTRSKLCNCIEKRGRQARATGRSTVQQLLASQPAKEEEAEWEREYRKRLFDCAAKDVQSEFQPATWQAFWLTAVDDVASSQVADRLEISVGAVYIAKSRVLKRIRERVTEIDDATLPLPEVPGITAT